MNLAHDGLDILFKEYECVMHRKMWALGEGQTIGSGALYAHVNTVLPPKPGKGSKEAISRASVIFAANRFVDAGIWDWRDATGKGGHHRLYFAIMTEAEMWTALKDTAVKKIDKLLG